MVGGRDTTASGSGHARRLVQMLLDTSFKSSMVKASAWLLIDPDGARTIIRTLISILQAPKMSLRSETLELGLAFDVTVLESWPEIATLGADPEAAEDAFCDIRRIVPATRGGRGCHVH